VAVLGELSAAIRDEIRSRGPITFARFMELALYHPELGYYRSHVRFGTAGDFYTAEQLQPVFGELLASYVAGLAADLQPYSVLELGAGRRDMGNELALWNYRPFDLDTEPLPDTWHGLVFANEFFDALPVHLLSKQGGGWKQQLVGNGASGFQWTAEDVFLPELIAYAESYGREIPEGGQLEACLAVDEWLSRVAALLTHGHLLVIDYGYNVRELARFPSGTLLSYRRHQTHVDVLREPGRQDITAHVNFTWLESCARGHSLRVDFSQSLAQWALSVWDQAELERKWANADSRWRRQWKQIVFGLGETFRVTQLHRER
jgi:SAM-dependent MidA family methyltransferase